ncbi:MAG TPA: T9SS type A sorting domain-containing protein [Ignavibacteriaceae bacterium]|nr:T9SS type A sorting domain-containing protein [Ignavibacteriaceae bacterium]
MKKTLMIICISTLLVNAQYKIDRFAFTSGGNTSTSSTNIIKSSVGLIVTGKSTSASNIVNIGFWYIAQTLTGVKDENTIPFTFNLYQNYPNPFNPSTTIKYDLPQESNVILKVYNLLGQTVATIVNTNQKAGTYEYKWDASRFSSGFYIYRIETNKNILTKKMLFLK